MLRKQPQPVRHEHLAAELTDASQHHNEVVAQSRDRLDAVRASVVQRATERRQAIIDIQADLDIEEQRLSELIAGAK